MIGSLYIVSTPIGNLGDISRRAIETIKNEGQSNILIFHSLSKRSNVAGLRSGFLIGDAKIINCYRKFRSYSAPTIPIPIQLASAELWKNKKHILEYAKQYFSNKLNI